MNDADKLVEKTKEIYEILLAMETYLNRNRILVDKLVDLNLPPSYLEEWGEFLSDWGKQLQKFGKTNKERDKLLSKILGIKYDD